LRNFLHPSLYIRLGSLLATYFFVIIVGAWKEQESQSNAKPWVVSCFIIIITYVIALLLSLALSIVVSVGVQNNSVQELHCILLYCLLGRVGHMLISIKSLVEYAASLHTKSGHLSLLGRVDIVVRWFPSCAIDFRVHFKTSLLLYSWENLSVVLHSWPSTVVRPSEIMKLSKDAGGVMCIE